MCILFLLVGDESRPTLICNNRDEYFNRPTTRGTLNFTDFSYTPKDLEGGGTWLSVTGLRGGSEFRFAVVLNLHDWREREVNTIRPVRCAKRFITRAGGLSRGLLTKNFTENADIRAIDYAKTIFKNRDKYHPFNLVVSDSSGTFYVSSSLRQNDVERLHPGRLYALANGYLHDTWDKTSIGKYFVEQALVHELAVCSRPPSSPVDFDSVPLTAAQLNHSTIKDVVDKLCQVMETDTPLADPTFGRRSMYAMIPSGIFARPIIILRRPLYRAYFLARHLVVEGFNLYLRTLKRWATSLFWFMLKQMVLKTVGFYVRTFMWLVSFVFCVKDNKTPQRPPARSYFQELRSWVQSVVVLSMFRPASYIALRNGTNWLLPDVDMFGTRTITIIAHLPDALQHPGASGGSGPQADTPRNDSTSFDGEKRITKVDDRKEAAYYILERDLDTQRMTWSDAVFTNIPPVDDRD
jgi:uncharacterized protein with NRDE domain